MNDRDQLERLLKEIGTASPDAGFEQRVLRGIERHRLTPARRCNRHTFLGFGLASALASAACVSLAVFHRVHEASPVVGRSALPILQTSAPTAPVFHLAANLRSRSSAIQQKAQLSGPVALVSFPAPPAPLTEQERLLLRVAQRHSPVEEAMLRVDALPLEEERARDEFRRFFPPADPPANEIPAVRPTDGGNSPTPAAPAVSTAKDLKGDPQ